MLLSDCRIIPAITQRESTHTWHETNRLKPGNANLPIGVSHDAIQENGVPGQLHRVILHQTGIEEIENLTEADRVGGSRDLPRASAVRERE
jgi:hypothetical protein